MKESVILPVWRSGEVASLPGVLAEDATFSSPVADYHGRAHVAHMLGLIARVLDDIEPGSSWQGDDGTVIAFAAQLAGDELQGLLHERHDQSGGLVYVTLFLRPYATLTRAIQRMRDLLAESPLPRQMT